MTTILLWVAAVVFVEAVTELMLNASVLDKFRTMAHNFSEFTSELISCGYCLSVWVSASIAWALPLGFSFKIVDVIVATFVLHRLSNVFHEFVSRWLGRMPWMLQLHKTETVLIEDNNGRVSENSTQAHQE